MKDLFSIAGKTALVTGGSRGIGFMIARGFVEAGATVTIAARKREEVERAAAELGKHGSCTAHRGRSLHRGGLRARSPKTWRAATGRSTSW